MAWERSWGEYLPETAPLLFACYADQIAHYSLAEKIVNTRFGFEDKNKHDMLVCAQRGGVGFQDSNVILSRHSCAMVFLVDSVRRKF